MVILALIVTWINGWVLLEWLAPVRPDDTGPIHWLRWFLAYGVGIVVQGVLTYVSLLATDRLHAAFVGEAALVLAAVATRWMRRRAIVETSVSDPIDEPQGIVGLGGLAFLLAALEMVVTYFLAFRRWQTSPLGFFDNVAQWTGRAIFIAAGDERWREILSPLQIHGDYPLLVPLTIGRVIVWSGASEPSLFAPLAVMMAMSAATVGIIGTSLAVRRGAFVGAIGAMLLLSTPLYLTWTAALLADIPLIYFYTATFALWATLRPADSSAPGFAPTPGTFILLGVMLAGAVACKNEGLVFAGEAIAIMTIVGVIQTGPRATVRNVAMTLLGVAVAGATVAHFKIVVATSSTDIVEHWSNDRFGQLLDAERWRLIAFYAGDLIVKVVRVWMVVLVGLVFLAQGTRWPRGGELCCGIGTMTMAATYWLVYVLTPLDLDWHVRASLDRILLHLLPVAYFSVMLFAAEGERSRWRGIAAALAFALAAWGGFAAARALPTYPLPANIDSYHRWMVDLRFHELRDHIPRDAHVSFFDAQQPRPGDAFMVARFILAPRAMDLGKSSEWIITSHPTPADADAFCTAEQTAIVVDLTNGYRLVRRP